MGFQIDGNNVPHISYYDDVEKHLYYGDRSLGSWVINKIDSIGDIGKYSVMEIDDQNQVNLCYLQTLTSDSSILYHSYLSGGNWVKMALDTIAGVSGSARKILSLQQDSAGSLHLMYGTTKKIVYLKQKSTSWESEIIFNGEQENVLLGEGINFKLDNLGNAHVVFYQKTEGNPIGWKVRYLSDSAAVSQTTIITNKKTTLVQVFPNPFDSHMTLKGLKLGSVVKLVDGQGRTMLKRAAKSEQMDIDIRSIYSGLYFIETFNRKGAREVIKVLKK